MDKQRNNLDDLLKEYTMILRHETRTKLNKTIEFYDLYNKERNEGVYAVRNSTMPPKEVMVYMTYQKVK